MDELLAYSRRQLAQGSQSFAQAAKLFPPDIRRSATLLYAFCRYCDDALDGQTLGQQRRALSVAEQQAAYADLHRNVEQALAGQAPNHPAFAALQDVVTRHRIPHGYVWDLLRGMEMDIGPKFCHTPAETLTYCYHVAGVVGLMMATIFGVTDQDTLNRACDLGIAFQLTNICRDIVDDAQHGRVYLPQNWLADVGIPEDLPPQALTEASYRPALAMAARRALTEAELYYESAKVGIGRLPWRIGWAIAGALQIYRGIGLQVLEHGDKAWDRRMRVNGFGKLACITTAGIGVGCGRYRLVQADRSRLWTRR